MAPRVPLWLALPGLAILGCTGRLPGDTGSGDCPDAAWFRDVDGCSDEAGDCDDAADDRLVMACGTPTTMGTGSAIPGTPSNSATPRGTTWTAKTTRWTNAACPRGTSTTTGTATAGPTSSGPPTTTCGRWTGANYVIDDGDATIHGEDANDCLPSALDIAHDDVRITAVASGDSFRSSVAVVADESGEGATDIAIGVPGADTGANGGGAAYLVAGPLAGNLSGSSATATLVGTARDGHLGQSVAAAGDYNGDRNDDLLAGSYDQRTVWLLLGGAY